MIIDVHAHCFPKEYLDDIERKGGNLVDVARYMRAGIEEQDLELRLAVMKKAGVDLQVLSIVPQVPYFSNKNDAVSSAKMANDIYAQLIAKYPKHFQAFGIFPLPHIQESLDEIKRCFDDLGMLGVTVTTTVLQRSIVEADRFEAIFAELNRRKAVVFLHPAGCCTGEQTKVYGLTWMIGAPFEDTYGVLHLILSGITTRYPDIHFISTHLGGYLPLIMQRIDNLYSDWGEGNIEGVPSDFIKKFWFDTVAHGHIPALHNAVAVYPHNQLLLGTDYPYANHDKYLLAVDYIKEANLPEELVKKILSDNAKKLFNL
ncbi:amidohydrolase family protein [Legionella jordanis]|uniref:5-carboxyvanillate decarboxylase n=1 Tax=Legionella jordanis TaxID=456 RepID=A0A0W0V8E6_9GAMM|nr:amidohydrolase family protein [Legionella jordanis]KTD16150.1 5-carboxyvanillate decarboxylase [Legionella jordanis]RMX04624.1 amidohydrolase [Legionella jordanis]VEH12390.1 5-carboxyvanillate decarboxylase [Legionella jordanis]HAT8713903.1 amidohydrolase family protein [Legionella jordanis]